MSAKNSGRWRCLVAGCNPALDRESARFHSASEGHRVATWPVRSAEGERRARARNKNGYYDKYNVGAKSAVARGIRGGRAGYPDLFDNYDNDDYDWDLEDDTHPFSEDAFN